MMEKMKKIGSHGSKLGSIIYDPISIQKGIQNSSLFVSVEIEKLMDYYHSAVIKKVYMHVHILSSYPDRISIHDLKFMSHHNNNCSSTRLASAKDEARLNKNTNSSVLILNSWKPNISFSRSSITLAVRYKSSIAVTYTTAFLCYLRWQP